MNKPKDDRLLSDEDLTRMILTGVFPSDKFPHVFKTPLKVDPSKIKYVMREPMTLFGIAVKVDKNILPGTVLLRNEKTGQEVLVEGVAR